MDDSYCTLAGNPTLGQAMLLQESWGTGRRLITRLQRAGTLALTYNDLQHGQSPTSPVGEMFIVRGRKEDKTASRLLDRGKRHDCEMISGT